MLEAVIFDMDGVIVDSEPIHFKVDQRVLEQCGVIADAELLNPYVGVSNPDMWADLKEKHNLSLRVDELLKLQNKLKIEVYNEMKIDAIDGIRELLADLQKNKIAMALASSSPRFFIEMVLEKLQIKDYFNPIVSGEEVTKGKPFPDIFLKAAEILDVEPKDCLVIEDSTNGIKASLSAGMKSVGFVNPHSGLQDVSKASTVVDSFYKVTYDFLKRICSNIEF